MKSNHVSQNVGKPQHDCKFVVTIRDTPTSNEGVNGEAKENDNIENQQGKLEFYAYLKIEGIRVYGSKDTPLRFVKTQGMQEIIESGIPASVLDEYEGPMLKKCEQFYTNLFEWEESQLLWEIGFKKVNNNNDNNKKTAGSKT
ncbi:hypothetical protein RFI_40203 [Reticulomyxa filosa]|uniref:Uncharacterized protein n=1 Tax=Reticulomyxa filosa TaxID=46433 RepID=X6L713_RETFI|nr:hypothetical protein RFI_40203 [Reticulomyxa filosa]|eukprot:ETN97327.1 hypothetical protein RFI_40203 [Reticulomyxa filosa]